MTAVCDTCRRISSPESVSSGASQCIYMSPGDLTAVKKHRTVVPVSACVCVSWRPNSSPEAVVSVTACVCYLEELADEAGGRLRDEVGDVETTGQGAPEGVPGIPRQRFEGGVPNQHLKDEHSKGPVVCCLGCASSHDHLRSLYRQTGVHKPIQYSTSWVDFMHVNHMSLICIQIACCKFMRSMVLCCIDI